MNYEDMRKDFDVDFFKNFTSKIKPTKKDVERVRECTEKEVSVKKVKSKDSGIFTKCDGNAFDGKVDQAEIIVLKEMIRTKRLELFKSKLESYHWNPESRNSMFW